MEIVTTIISEWLCPLIFACGGTYALVMLVNSVAKAMKAESDNTIRLNIALKDVPSDMGNVFKDIFSNVFGELVDRYKGGD